MSPAVDRQHLLQRINELSAWFVWYIRHNTAMHLQDIHVIAENLLIPIFREAYGYEDLENLNLTQGNFPGIDLGDRVKGVAIQVTATARSAKITNTLQKYIAHNEERAYKKLIVYIISEKQASYAGQQWPALAREAGLEFDKEQDIRDYRDLMARISGLSLDKIRRIVAIYNENFARQYPYIEAGEQPCFFVGVLDLPRYGLVGRDALLDDLVTRLTSGSAVSLSTSGQGGAGKTALAAAVAYHRRVLGHFNDGVLWASVGPQGDPMLGMGRWAERLGLNVAEYPEPHVLSQAVKDAIGQRRLLLVLDDIWELAQAELLRCGGPNCAYLLTSRDNGIARRFAGGQGNALRVPDLKREPAFALLAKIAPEATAVDETVARALVRQVGGLPLAVELLGGYLAGEDAPDAALFPDLSEERLAELGDPALRLRQAQACLGDQSGEKVTLVEVMALSLDGFSETEQKSFYALGTFAPKPATFSRPAAEAVSGADGSLLSQFVNLNLLEIESGAFALHQVFADLAHTRMDEEAQVRHAAFYLDLVNEDRADWRRIDRAYEQIRWAWEKADEAACLDWVWALEQHQSIRGLLSDFIAWHKRGLAWARTNVARKDIVTLLNKLGWAYDVTGHPVDVLRLYEEALPITREVGDRVGEAMTLNNIGELYGNMGRSAETLRLFEDALSIFREVGDRAGEAMTLNNMGEVFRRTGQTKDALRHYEDALPIRREVGDLVGEILTLNGMGILYNTMGRQTEALRLYEEALPITREMGDRAGEAMTLNNMGFVCQTIGRQTDALRLYKEALHKFRKVGDRAGEATTLWNLVVVLEHLERLPDAIDYIQQALTLFHDGLTHSAGGYTVEQYEDLVHRLQETQLGS